MPVSRLLERRTVLVLLMAALLAPVAASGQAAGPPRDYVVGAQDVLTISVYGQADLTGKFSVETDGTFTFPLIGRLKAAGLTLRAIEDEIRRKLAAGFVLQPGVSVSVEQYRSQQIFFVGEVQKPGPYSLTGDTTLIQALARAGSVTPDASGELVIVRPRPGEAAAGPTLPAEAKASEIVRVNIAELQSGAAGQNVTLRDGDTVFVPRGEKVFVYGQVRNPGSITIQKGTTVLQVLSLAGGLTERGAANRVRIERLVGGVKKQLKVKLSDLVQGGDTLIVPERFF